MTTSGNQHGKSPDSSGTKIRTMLILKGPKLEGQGIIELLQSQFDVQVVSDSDEAMAVIRGGQVDAVVAETADFLPLERGIVTQQAAAILDQIADGVCLAGPDGQIIWANRQLQELPDQSLEGLRVLCVQAFNEFRKGRGDDVRGKRYSLIPADGSYSEVLCSPVRDEAGRLKHVSAVVVDATRPRQQQRKINAIDQAGRELVRLDFEAISQKDATERLTLLEERIIRFSRDVLNYKHWALLLLDAKTNRLEMLVCEGLDDIASEYELFASAEGNGITGYVAATGRSYICANTRKDPRYLMSLPNPGSSLTVPLRMHDRVIGVLHVESDETDAFGEEDRQFADIFANYVALALNVLNLLVIERHATHSRLSGTVTSQLSGPINDVITEAGELMDDYIGHDDLRQRLQHIVDRASEIRETVKQWSRSGETGVLPTGETAQTDPRLAGKKILVVDDEVVIRETVCDILVPYGCDVDSAADGIEATDKIGQTHYDLVISDIKMPGATGYDVFAAAKAASSETEVILITAFGYDPGHSIVKANREGLAAVLMKPFKVNDLLKQVRQALSK